MSAATAGGIVAAISCLFAIGTGSTLIAAHADQGSSNHRAIAGEKPDFPQISLASLQDVEDESLYMTQVNSRVNELIRSAESHSDPGSKSVALLAAANLILSERLEPACSLAIHRLPRIPNDQSGEELDHVDRLLTQADLALQTIGNEAAQSPEIESARKRLESLRAFGSGLRVFLRPESVDERQSRRAASALAAMLEESNPAVSASAALWHALIRSREADVEPALGFLEPALADLPRNAGPAPFFSRILRCRLLAAKGSPAAALALLIQMEERVADWFSVPEARTTASRAIVLAQVQILSDWHDQLTSPDVAAEREWCANRMRALMQSELTPAPTLVARLGTAIPVLVASPIPPANPTARQPEP